MKISLIVPVYNAARFLRECLDSFAAQTYRDWECICVDDGSADGSAVILDKYASQDGRFIVKHTVNRGVSAARNLGIELASGDYIGFVDADDTIAPDWLENAVEAIERSGTDLVRFEWENRLDLFSQQVSAEDVLKCGFVFLTFTRSEILKAMHESSPHGMRLREDTIFLLKVLRCAKTSCQECGIGYFHRINTESAVYSIQKVDDFIRFVDELVKVSQDIPRKTTAIAIYKSLLWWRTQHDRSVNKCDQKREVELAKKCLARARDAGVFSYAFAPLLWVRGFWLADAYIAFRRKVNPKWLP